MININNLTVLVDMYNTKLAEKTAIENSENKSIDFGGYIYQLGDGDISSIKNDLINNINTELTTITTSINAELEKLKL